MENCKDMYSKQKILQEVEDVTETKGRNSMGVSESYYNPFYLISRCFKYKELEKLNKEELNNLYKLAEFSSEVFY